MVTVNCATSNSAVIGLSKVHGVTLFSLSDCLVSRLELSITNVWTLYFDMMNFGHLFVVWKESEKAFS